MAWKKNNGENEELVPLGKLDPQTCEKLKGFQDENGMCKVRIEDTKDKNTVRIRALKYSRSANQD